MIPILLSASSSCASASVHVCFSLSWILSYHQSTLSLVAAAKAFPFPIYGEGHIAKIQSGALSSHNPSLVSSCLKSAKVFQASKDREDLISELSDIHLTLSSSASRIQKRSMVEIPNSNVHSNGSINGTVEERLDELRRLMDKAEDDPLRIVGVGAGAWGSVFLALLQESYGHLREKIQIRIWRRAGRAVDRATAEHLFEVINSREEVLRRLIRRCAYLKYVEGRLGDRTLYADEILKDGFCLNMIDTPVCPLKVVTNLQEAVWDADIVVNGLPSTETAHVFKEISIYWKERINAPVIISLAKGIEAELDPIPRIITPTQMIHRATGVPMENILYLGGPNIASEIYNKEYANARICGAEKWRKPLAKFLRQPHFIVWDNGDLVTHEVMGGLKNVYAIGAGMVAALTKESATSKSVYFAHCTSEMIFITHLLAEKPERLAGPLLADTYVTLLKGRNAWYGQMLAKGELSLEMGDSIKGKGMIQGVSAVKAFCELLSQSSLSVLLPKENKPIAPVELCPILRTLYNILISRKSPCDGILQALRDETMSDPRELIEIAQSHAFYVPSLLGQVD